ncbi:MAG: ribonuclease H-like domain-containing protein [Calditrichaeota bacterium]|nr:ribonuclease H-like domain-containing protein [Calditrichota bacterium]
MANHLAFDIETVPAADLSEYSEAVQKKINEKIEGRRERQPDFDYPYYASTHGDFGKIVCISMGYLHGDRIKLKSLYGHDEFRILEEFNKVCASIKGIFIHYNGLGFDVPFILQRMAHHNIRPANPRFTNLRRFSSDPHFDIMMQYYNWDMSKVLPLGILAELHGMPSPKADLSGDKVYEAYLNNQMERIARYCEFDVGTTVNLWNKVFNYEPVIGVENYDFTAPAE